MAAEIIKCVVLEQQFGAACAASRLNTRAMTELSTIAAALSANFATIRIPRCERLWKWPEPDPSPRLRAKPAANALAGETLIGSCHRQCVRGHLLEAGHRAFFDRIEGGGADGWRLHLFCLYPAAVALWRGIGLGQSGPGDPVAFDAVKFVVHRLRRLERQGLLGTLDRWWVSVDE